MTTLMTAAEAARLLNLQPQTLRKWRTWGKGPRYVRLGGPRGRVAYRHQDIDAWIEAQTFASTSEETAGEPLRSASPKER